ncbi:MAG: RNA polymerase sigma factor [Candidatus Firestonebacteria bacterium]
MTEDVRLIEEFLQGSETAFNRLVNKYSKKVYYLALRLLCNHHDAEEASQEAFLKAYGSLKKLKEKKYFFTWLYRITYNVCMTQKTRVKYADSLDLAAEVRDLRAGYHIERIEREELRGRVKALMEKLPKQQKAVFIMRIYDGMKFEEIAGVTGLSTGGVKSNFFNAVQKIKSGVKDQYEL